MLTCSRHVYFRCIFQGITIPKEVSPYHLRSLQLAMQIRDGFIPELALHQRKVQKMTEISRCSVVKYVRPLYSGFQCLYHCFPSDTVITLMEGKNHFDDQVRSLSIEELKKSVHKYEDYVVQLTIEFSLADIQKIPAALFEKLNPGIVEDSLALVRRRALVPIEMFLNLHVSLPELASKILDWSLVKTGKQCEESIVKRLYSLKLRRIPFKQRDQIAAAVSSTKQDGFLNYFSPIVFGKLIKRGYIFGSHVFHQEYRAILNILLNKRNNSGSLASDDDCFPSYDQETSVGQLESHTIISSKEREKIISGAKKLMLSAKGDTLTGLEDCSEKDVEKVLLHTLDQRTLLKWVRELCCMIWNTAVSRRVATYGAFHILPGDIVLRSNEYVFLTANDVKSNKYSPYDILMPVPGPQVSLPQNECALIYESIFATFRMPKDMEKWSIPLLENGFTGAYRPMIVRPTKMKHRITSDRDCHSVDLSFRLPYGSFASMCVREIVKLEMNTPAECGIDVSAASIMRGKSKVDVPLAEVKPRNFSEAQKRQYQEKYDPGRKKFTSSRALHKARLLNVIYRRILPRGTERWRKLSVNGKL